MNDAYIYNLFLNITLLYFFIINLVTFCLFGIDKLKAVKQRWRIRESVLLGFSLFGGAAGGIIGMKVFHHKTLKKAFSVGIPLMLVLHIVLIFVYILFVR